MAATMRQRAHKGQDLPKSGRWVANRNEGQILAMIAPYPRHG